MTTRDTSRRDTVADVQNILARARPDQMRRLLDDVRACGTGADEGKSKGESRGAA